MIILQRGSLMSRNRLLLGSNAGLEPKVLLEMTVVVDVLKVAAVLEDLVFILRLLVLVLHHIGEAPALGNDDLLTASELVTGAAKSLHDDRTVVLPSADREEDLADVDSGHGVVRLAVGTTHACLEPVGTSARKHLVDTDDVERVDTDTEVERILARSLGDVLVGANASSFECLRGDLLVLVTDKVAAEGEVVNACLLAAEVKDADLKEH